LAREESAGADRTGRKTLLVGYAGRSYNQGSEFAVTGVLSDVEIFVDLACRVGEEGPVRTNSGARFIRLSDVVGANRDQPAIANLELAMKLKKQFMLPAVLWTVTAPAEHENHWISSLQFGELAPLCRVIGKFVIGEYGPWNNVRSHMQTTFLVGT
jgi:hypothetical protein